ncbi:MAG: adenylate/guanylate cyclase domain-containing response regulator [Cyanobacteriota bacterium]|nr:adenylate/guanylate cyclase domain-containing response regulator [Cyanobacteriota bacterium]
MSIETLLTNEKRESSPADDDEVIFAEEDGDESDEVIFASEDDDEAIARPSQLPRASLEIDCDPDAWVVLSVDDQMGIREAVKMILADFKFEGKPLQVLEASSEQEARAIANERRDIALMFVDVVMEREDSGLQLVRYIREELGNTAVRLVLLTGQPGQAPEDEVVVRYDIDNYLTKTEFTNRKLFSTVVTALRAFRTIAQLEQSKREMAQLANASMRFVPARFLQLLNKKSLVDVELGNSVEKKMSVLFADIRSFTSLSEQMGLEDNFKFINSYLSRMEPAIAENGGFIDKYLGDGIMALFEQTADDALRAAIAMLKVLAEYNQTRQHPRRPPLSVGIGINTGDVMLGTIGGHSRIDSTAIGDTVNLAARLEQLTKVYQSPLLISHDTLWSLHDPMAYCVRFIGRVQVKGKAKLVGVFEVFDAEPIEIREAKLQTKSMFELALVYHYQGQLEEAMELLEECVRQNPEDAIAMAYLARDRKRALV